MERMAALQLARQEAAIIMTEFRLRRVLATSVPPSARFNISPGDPFRVYSEQLKLWQPVFTLLRTSRKIIWINDGARVIQVHRSHVLPDFPPTNEYTGLKQLLAKLRPFNTQAHPTVLATEVLSPSDIRAHSSHFDKAKAKEIYGLLARRAFSIFKKNTLPGDANILGGHFLLAKKYVGTANELYKARFVVQGHTDRDKNLIVYTSSTVLQASVRLLVALTAVLGFHLWT